MSELKDKNMVTMKDVAKHAGVSQSTVSFVLSNVAQVSISEDTRRRVLASAQELNYRRRAQGLTAKPPVTPVIGFMVDEIATSPWAAATIEGAQEAAWRQGHILEVIMTGEDVAYEAAALNKWQAQGKSVTGVIYCSILTRAVTPPESLKQLNSVLVNCHSDEIATPAVLPSEIMGGFAGTQSLIDRGYRNIAFIGGEMWMEAAKDRLAGYRNALITNNIAINERLIKSGNFLPSGGYKQTVELMKGKLKPDAIFCCNDLTAIGCYEALKEQGLRIPQDVAVLGYDDEEISQHLNPKLSTIVLPHKEMGQWAVDFLISPPSNANQVIKLECPVVLREST